MNYVMLYLLLKKKPISSVQNTKNATTGAQSPVFITKSLQITKAFIILIIIFTGLLLTVIFSVLLRWKSNHPIYKRTARWWLSTVCTIVGLKIKVLNSSSNVNIRTNPKQPIMYVSNHISWLDIPLLGSIFNPRFLSKQSVRKWPMIGWLAEKSGTLFITRGGKVNQQQTSTHSAAQQISNCLLNNESVLIFPEGTTTDGTNVRRFHGRLFSSAIETKALIQPVAIRYLNESGTPSVLAPFVGDQTFVDNLWKLLSSNTTHVEVYLLKPVESDGKSRNELARYCENVIRNELFNND